MMFISGVLQLQLLLSLTAVITAQNAPYQPCPILGPRFPIPTGLLTSKTMQSALASLTETLDNMTASSRTKYTDITPNTTSFSIVLFAANETKNASQPFIYEYHHTAPSLAQAMNGSKEANSNSIYNIGSLTHIFTVYAFLVAAGEQHWLDSVTQHVPRLASTASIDSIGNTTWSDIQLIDLATYLAGLSRTNSLNTLSDLNIPSGLSSILPATNASSSTSAKSKQEFLEAMLARRPVYLPSTTPIYSDAGFQLLALSMESITGKSFDRIMTDAIIDPLKLSSTTLGTPQSEQNAVIPSNATTSGWQVSAQDSFLLAATSMFSSASDLAVLGRAIMRSSLISPAATRRWFKPHSHTSNLVDDVGAPWTIYKATRDGTATGAVVPVYTKLGANGLYSPYFGIVPDFNVGFAILSADTSVSADLNAYADTISEVLFAALETTATQEAAVNFRGRYSGLVTSANNTSNVTLVITADKLSGLSVTNWTSTSANSNSASDIRAAYAELAVLPPSTLDFRLYPTNLESGGGSNGVRNMAFRAVLQDIAAPVDAGTPTCITWFNGVDELVWNGQALDEFDFELDGSGKAVAVNVAALNMRLVRG